MRKLDEKIDKLIADKRIKAKWSELECHGASEFLNMVFQDQVGYGNLAQSIIVENNIVCVNLYEGAPYKAGSDIEMLIRMYIDLDDNILFLSRSGNVYLYETEHMDASDLRHYYGKD